MKKGIILVLMAIVGFGGSAYAAVQLNGPSSLTNEVRQAGALSAQLGLFEFSLSQNAGEALTSVGVLVQANASSTVTSSDLGALNLYRDNGDGAFNPSVDVVAGSQGTVNIGTPTIISATSNNSLSSATSTPTKFFVSLGTGTTWSDSVSPDSITVALVENSIVTSSNSPVSAKVTAPAILADTTGPKLMSAVAQNTGGTGSKEAGDSLVLTFNEATNKVAVTSATLSALLTVGNGHSLLDSSLNLGSTSWDSTGKILTITLSGSSSTTVPSVSVGDPISISVGTPLVDQAGNKATGLVTIMGTFGTITPPPSLPTDSTCTNTLINGRLYSVQGYMFIYQAKDCRLVLLKGDTYYPVSGNQFGNVIHLNLFPQPGQLIDPVVDPAKQAKLELKELLKQRRAEIEIVRQKYEAQIEALKAKIDAHERDSKEQKKEEQKKFKWFKKQSKENNRRHDD